MAEEKSKILKFKVSSFKKIPNPYIMSKLDAQKKPEMFELMVDVKDLPDNIPMGTNPREQNTNTNVGKKIKDSLLNRNDLNFYLLNRGLLLSADSITFDGVKSEVSIVFSDLTVHGDVDGGHTYRVILDNRSLLERGDQYVKVEVLTGIEDFFEDLAAARNTSVQVKDKSLEELRDHFDIIKRAIGKESYFEDISYKENDKKRIDVLDILAVMNMFNIDRYPISGKSYPINSYNGKNSCLQYYIKEYKDLGDSPANPYVKMGRILPDIFKLYDQLECNIGNYYNPDGGKKYGSVKGVVTHKPNTPMFKSKFLQKEMNYESPNGFIYPILGSFRALVVKIDGGYSWKKDPFKAMDRLGPKLVNSVVDISRQLRNNPQTTGRSPTAWENLFMAMMLDALIGNA